MKKFKRIVASGCSFTSNEFSSDDKPWAWPNHLAINQGLEVHNLGIGGAGNDHISRSLIVYLEQNNFDPKETLIAAMWSGIGRIDFITGIEVPDSKTKYQYTDQTQLIAGGNWWNISRPNGAESALLSYSKYQNDHSFALTSWLAMNSLENYLKTHNYSYFFTSFVSYQNNNIKGDATIVNYEAALAKMNLRLDKSAWLPFDDSDYLGDWCKKTQQLGWDNWHPSPDAPIYWTKQVLEPMLIQQGYFDGI